MKRYRRVKTRERIDLQERLRDFGWFIDFARRTDLLPIKDAYAFLTDEKHRQNRWGRGVRGRAENITYVGKVVDLLVESEWDEDVTVETARLFVALIPARGDWDDSGDQWVKIYMWRPQDCACLDAQGEWDMPVQCNHVGYSVQNCSPTEVLALSFSGR